MLERVAASDGMLYQRSTLLAESGAPHLFTSRRGAGGRDLDLVGLGLADHPDEERLRSAAGFDAEVRFVAALQVHGAGVVEARPEPFVALPAADALVSSLPTRAVVVFSADCVPILVARADGRRVAAIHAGWRGLIAGVIPAALEALRGRAEGEFVAAIGPCLSLARFEVGCEVAAQFELKGLAEVVHAGFGPNPHVDLRRAAALQLAAAGIEAIDVDERCTWDDPELYSYRRDVTHGTQQRTGRLAAIIAPRA